jgi:peptidoglycan/LPS O-acetylase OafA/YrhL
MESAGAANGRGRVGYEPALDGIRAWALLGVITAHAGFSHLPSAGIGLYVFFVLSGYLITHLLLVEAETTAGVSLGRFYGRRALRLLPALVLVLIASGVWALADGGPSAERTLRGIPFVALYVGNWANAFSQIGGTYDLGLLGHTWSLSVEEQFYLLWPLLLIFVLGHSDQRWTLVRVALGLAALSAVSRIAFWGSVEHPLRLHGTDQAADAILIGCALGATFHAVGARGLEVLRIAARWLVWPGLALVLVVAARVNGLTQDEGDLRLLDWLLLPAIAVAAAILIAHVVLERRSPLGRFLAIRPVAWVGKISYGIYLWHLLVIRLLGPHVDGPEGLRVLVLTAASIAIGAASYYGFELRFLRLKRRLEVVPTRTANPPQPALAPAAG